MISVNKQDIPVQINSLKFIHLLLVISKLLQNTSEFSLVLGANLTTTNSLIHPGGSTDKDLHILRLRLGENRLQQLLRDKAGSLRPVRRRLVKEVKHAETLRIRVFQLLKLALQQDVVLGDVAVDEGDLGLVVGRGEDLADQLVHGRDSCAARYHAEVVVLVGFPRVFGERTLEGQTLAYGHVMEVS